MTALARVIVVVLACVAIARGALFLAHDPLLSLANNHDMIRVQGCIEAYPVREASIHPGAGSYEAPIERYAFRTDVGADCYFTSEAAFAFLALPLMRAAADRAPDGAFSIRIAGAVKFAAFSLLLALGMVAFWRRLGPLAALAFAAVAAVVLVDPAQLLYASGFYAEYAALLFLCAAIVTIAIGLASTGRARGAWLLAGVIVLALATSKVQHLALGLVLALLAGAAQWLAGRRVGGSFGWLLLAGALGFALQLAHYRSDRTTAMQHANLTNTVIATLFVMSGDPHRTAEHLGLPRRCGDHAGRNWYAAEMHERPPCPELFELTRVDLLALAIREPRTLWRTYWGGFARLRPWIPDGLGVVEGETLGRLPPGWFTWARVLERMAPAPLLALCVLPGLLVAAGAAAGYARRIGPGATFAWLALALVPFAVVGAMVFGDGYIDVPRQGSLVFACVLSFWTALAICATAAIARGIAGALEQRAWRRSDAARAASRFPSR